MSGSSSSGRAARLAAVLALAVSTATPAAGGASAPVAGPAPARPGTEGRPASARPAADPLTAPRGPLSNRSDLHAKRGRPDPADPAAAVPPVRHDAPLAGYTPMREDRSGWREVNDSVHAAGGHIGIMRDEMRRQQDARRPAAPKEAR